MLREDVFEATHTVLADVLAESSTLLGPFVPHGDLSSQDLL